MKFEQLLQMYWGRGFLYGGVIVPFEETSFSLFTVLPGFARRSSINLITRLEYSWFFNKRQSCLKLEDEDRNVINVYLCQITSIHHSINEGVRLCGVRLYLIKSFRGWRQAAGRPSRGQRTRSNAFNAFKGNMIVREFIAEFKRTHIKIEESPIFDYRKLRVKSRHPVAKYRRKVTKKQTNLWF